ncbi:MAG: hypothetical protein Q8K82_10910 [Gemmatimonadaceae bacterium]|nr:hypothetical protein [Gemmatimonadaceae bacterium]
MLVFTIPLGSAAELAERFAYPNIPGSSASLADTILHWFNQTLARDGPAPQGAEATVEVDGASYTLYLRGAPLVSNQLLLYTKRLPQFLQNCQLAIADIGSIKQATPNIWDRQRFVRWCSTKARSSTQQVLRPCSPSRRRWPREGVSAT